MAISVAELETLHDALIRARAKGVRELQMGGERLRYGSDAEMADAIADLSARIRQAQGTASGSRAAVISTTSGWR